MSVRRVATGLGCTALMAVSACGSGDDGTALSPSPRLELAGEYGLFEANDSPVPPTGAVVREGECWGGQGNEETTLREGRLTLESDGQFTLWLDYIDLCYRDGEVLGGVHPVGGSEHGGRFTVQEDTILSLANQSRADPFSVLSGSLVLGSPRNGLVRPQRVRLRMLWGGPSEGTHFSLTFAR